MAFVIITKNKEKTFNQKLINISSASGYDFQLDLGFDYILTVQYNHEKNKCLVSNRTNCDKFLFKGEILPEKLLVEKVCKIMVKDSDEFITIKILESAESSAPKQETNTINPELSNQKDNIESSRIKIIQEISGKTDELKRKLSMNSKFGILMHIALYIATFICAFGVSNYLMGLSPDTSSDVIQMPANLKLVFMYSLIVYSVGLMLKQGFFLLLQNKSGKGDKTSKTAEKIMIVISLIFFLAIYLINVSYYLAPKGMPLFAIFISLFYTGTCAGLSIGCGYAKSVNFDTRAELNKYEYRQDFEHIMRAYQGWIENYINSFTNSKLEKIKDKMLKLQMKSTLEIILGIITAPFLAYGVSNTLAMCFPEAAGWIRIGGLRFSPIFLVLATFLIIFAFFSFVNGFAVKKKIRASEIIKQDGFNNYFQHGVDIFGLEGIKRLDEEMRRYFLIGFGIILIEFSMNVSYFMGEIGGNLSGMFLSCVAALVPTALLIAETVMLSSTKFEMNAIEELLTKIDR